ncbi:MAG: hypothetical protein ACE5KK_06140, partial [Candidatus Brocadiales bacterium]
DCDVRDVNLLKSGRHFRLDGHTKAVVGRDDAENQRLETLVREGDALLRLADIPGPLCLVRGDLTDENLLAAARLTARFSKAKDMPLVQVTVGVDGVESTLEVAPADPARVQERMITKNK